MNDRIASFTPEKFPTATVNEKRATPFKPTAQQIELVEKILRKHLEKHEPKLEQKFVNYYRQYTGLKISGASDKIRANFMCSVYGDRWRKEWILVRDGGDCYFNFSFNPDKLEIYEFEKNGEA
jgi:selenocysteine lyase/cysteine desulfurase